MPQLAPIDWVLLFCFFGLFCFLYLFLFDGLIMIILNLIPTSSVFLLMMFEYGN
uniref:ATP synthase F0 subunit 8 n=1 Tax=Cephalothrix sp. SCS-2010 TaxID=743460 RepID=E7C1B1_9BILA|nr:ATP synthase F0 subunit 8 [Cephalothrix sp. SCS-2010]ADD62171.1 ATP synthase F0 subunit 8 [Cephalothrix sp. SCS-2010]